MRYLFFLKNYFILTLLLVALSNMLYAQHIGGTSLDTSTMKSHQKVYKAAVTIDSSEQIQETLVTLALKEPLYDETEYQKNISQYDLTKARQSWLNLLSVSANYNDQTFAKTTANSAYVYPKYFFGLTIPIGLFFFRSGDIKIAKANYAINEDKQKDLARTIRAEILTDYEQYKSYVDLMALQNQMIDDEEAVFLQAEQKFKDGSIIIEAYDAAAKNYNNELVKKIQLQLQLNTVKFQIEKMIGMKLEDALKLKSTN